MYVRIIHRIHKTTLLRKHYIPFVTVEILMAEKDLHFRAAEQAFVGDDLTVILVNDIAGYRQANPLPWT